MFSHVSHRHGGQRLDNTNAPVTFSHVIDEQEEAIV